MSKREKIKAVCFIIAAAISVAFAIGSVRHAIQAVRNQEEVQERSVSAAPRIAVVQLPAVSTPPPAVYLPVAPTPQIGEELEPTPAPTPAPEPTPYNPYAGIKLTDREFSKLAKLAYHEARGECFEGQVAVVQVALNRLLHPAYPDSIEDVLSQPNQFAISDCYTETQAEAVRAALSGVPVLDLNTDVTFFSQPGRLKCGSYFKTIGGHEFRTYT